jgi:hypothetical protein
MTFSFRSARAFLVVCCAAVCLAAVQVDAARGQAAKQSTNAPASPQKQLIRVKQMPLTEKHILGLLAATGEINSITDNAPEGINELRPETIAKLDAVAKKHGLASYDEYKTVDANAGLVMSGYDDVKNRYVGRDALIRLRIARVNANRKMSDQEKKDELTNLKDQLQFEMPPVAYSGNVALITKYYARLRESARGD